MPEPTIDAVADHGVVTGDTVSGTGAAAREVFDALSSVGIDLPDVFQVLEKRGRREVRGRPGPSCSSETQKQLDTAAK